MGPRGPPKPPRAPGPVPGPREASVARPGTALRASGPSGLRAPGDPRAPRAGVHRPLWGPQGSQRPLGRFRGSGRSLSPRGPPWGPAGPQGSGAPRTPRAGVPSELRAAEAPQESRPPWEHEGRPGPQAPRAAVPTGQWPWPFFLAPPKGPQGLRVGPTPPSWIPPSTTPPQLSPINNPPSMMTPPPKDLQVTSAFLNGLII